MREHLDGLSICVDCVTLWANGCDESHDPAGCDESRCVVAERQTEQWPDEDGGRWEIIVQSVCDECWETHGDLMRERDCPHTEPSFSWYRCDGCGSRLGGDRWPAVAIWWSHSPQPVDPQPVDRAEP